MDRPDEIDAMSPEAECGDGGRGQDQPDERSGDAMVDPFGQDDDGQDGGGDAHRPSIEVASAIEGRLEATYRCRGPARCPEDGGDLADGDLDGESCQDASDDRRREEVGDPTEPQESNHGHHHADHEGQKGDQVTVLGRSHRGDGRRPGGDDRGDGRVGPDRHVPVEAQDGKHHRTGQERIQAHEGWKVRQSGGCHLLRYGDGGEGHSGLPPSRRPRRQNREITSAWS